MDEKAIMDKLQAPFMPDEIEWRVGATNIDKTKGIALAYVTNRAIQNRLDEVFGCFGWKNEYREWKGSAQICGISIWCEERKEWVTKWDGADDSNMEAIKGGLSDAMKRAAYQWGIGRYLYKLENIWVPIEQRGNSYVLKEIPPLPQWALPEGVKPQEQKPKSVRKEQTITRQELQTLMKLAGAKADDKASIEKAKNILTNAAKNHGYDRVTDIKKADYYKVKDDVAKLTEIAKSA